MQKISNPVAGVNSAKNIIHNTASEGPTLSERSIISVQKVIYIKNPLTVWLANVRSISGKSDESAKRKDRLKDLIKEHCPEIIILIETNHTSEPNLLNEYYDNFFTNPSENKGVIILTKKLFGCKLLEKFEDRGLVVKSSIIQDLIIIGSYCPYFNLKETTIEFLLKYQVGNWIIGGDFENNDSGIIQHLNYGFWGDIDYTREDTHCKTKTEQIGFFYSKPKLTRLTKISDHFVINAEIEIQWSGIKINFPPQISRLKAIGTLLNINSKASKELLKKWPEIDFKTVVH